MIRCSKNFLFDKKKRILLHKRKKLFFTFALSKVYIQGTTHEMFKSVRSNFAAAS